jgi:FkbM family methyltransferase
LGSSAALRKILLPLFSMVNPGDITIRHPFTGTPFRLHSFKHKGYWFYGKRRESETMRFFAEFIEAGDTVVEVGGHIGYISTYLSKLVGPEGALYVLEPGENNLPYLKRNTRSCPNVTIVEKGAADKDGELAFYLENLTGQNNSFVKDYPVLWANAQSAEFKPDIVEKSVSVVTIDGFIEARSLKPSFIKIDVEGFELQVLRGMSATLSAIKPGLMVEVTQNPGEVFDLLGEKGYLCFDRARDIVRDAAGMRDNIFCVHPEAQGDRIRKLGWKCCPEVSREPNIG